MGNQNDQNAFEEAVRLLRLGNTSSIEITSHLDDVLGKDKSSWQLLAEARTYLEELQTQAFDASVDAARRGEPQLEIERKLRALGFSPWNSGVIAERAKAKADAEQAQNATDD